MKISLILWWLTTNLLLYAQTRTIHVFVALCDNENQGIVPVSKALGNGQNPATNLYWGATYGVKNFFTKKSSAWTRLNVIQSSTNQILERIVFKHQTEDVFLLADAYDGAEIKAAITDFLKACGGDNLVEMTVKGNRLRFGGNSNLLVYMGHNGLMEFDLNGSFQAKDSKPRQAIILACSSKSYFSPYLRPTHAKPLLWTTGLMAPEAYTLEWALDAWIKNLTTDEIRQKAAAAYDHYQKCGLTAAKRLLVTGW